MDGHDDGVMIALLPINADWSRLELPHMTLVYAGKVQDQRPSAFNDMAKDASALAAISSPITSKVMFTDVFGDGTMDSPRVDVLRLRNSPEIMAMRHYLEKWNDSEHDFNPHVTVGPAGEGDPGLVPAYIAFDKIAVVFGNQPLIFNLRGM